MSKFSIDIIEGCGDWLGIVRGKSINRDGRATRKLDRATHPVPGGVRCLMDGCFDSSSNSNCDSDSG